MVPTMQASPALCVQRRRRPVGRIFCILFSFSRSLSFPPPYAPFAPFVIIARNRGLFPLLVLLVAPAAACYNCSNGYPLTISRVRSEGRFGKPESSTRGRSNRAEQTTRLSRRCGDRYLDTLHARVVLAWLIAEVATSFARNFLSPCARSRSAAINKGQKIHRNITRQPRYI